LNEIGKGPENISEALGLFGCGDWMVSSTVKDIVVGSDTRFEDRGQHSLKGIPGEWRLFSLAD
jgi:hypothetical protein